MSDSLPTPAGVASFETTLMQRGLSLRRAHTTILQINVGLRCDLACRHCHLDAGPHRSEMMSRATMEAVIDFARRGAFQTVDLTGGAPELAPDLPWFITQLRPLARQLLLRTNLTALAARPELLDCCVRERVALVASFPSTSSSTLEAQRGDGAWERCLFVLRQLNSRGYGQPGSGLDLHLAANPGGAFLPAGQVALEKKFRADLQRRWGIVFNQLFAFANVPLGRFRNWLDRSGNLDAYRLRLAESFNAEALAGVMCRQQVSVAWDGTLYDCDFNLAAGLALGSQPLHVTEAQLPTPGSAIATGEHCYACTAGAGFTCGGEIPA
jgi:radical SAM/Cys-rich protein